MPSYGQEILTCFELPKRSKKTSKMTFLPLFGHTISSVGRTQFWMGKWRPNLEITLVLESRQIDISNKSTWSKFGAWEGLQNHLQKGATHREINTVHRRKFAHFGQKTLFFA